MLRGGVGWAFFVVTTQTAAIDRLPEHLQEDAREFAEHYLPAYDELLQGHPRQMVESFLWIDEKVSQQVVRFNYNVNQNLRGR